jgi:hypothetical protein
MTRQRKRKIADLARLRLRFDNDRRRCSRDDQLAHGCDSGNNDGADEQ